ncbi:SH3 domain-containing protein [Zavarzinia sp. CC-PAN008]|uniref:SH3 domain-containing protein n=1 Tax=Zavarzinia sp. CC-PAN008 TaxID=3243332 RepID=UPI003F748608
MRRLVAGLLLSLALLGGLRALQSPGVQAQESVAAGPTDGEGLPTPRFVSLGSNEVNVRVGPGGQYPVSFTFIREDLPVEVIADFELWRKIRDFDGSEGWVHVKLLKGRRTVLVTGERRTLHARPEDAAPAVARADPGVIARLRKCQANWCEVEAKGYRGWLKREEFWGVYPGETIE